MYLLTITQAGDLYYEWLTLQAFTTRNSNLRHDDNEPETRYIILGDAESRSGLCGNQNKLAYADLVDCIMLETSGRDVCDALRLHIGAVGAGAVINHDSDNCLKQPYESPSIVTFFTSAYEVSGQIKARLYKTERVHCEAMLRQLKLIKLGI